MLRLSIVECWAKSCSSASTKIKKSPVKIEKIIERLAGLEYVVSKTQFNPSGFKTNAPIDVIEKVFKGD